MSLFPPPASTIKVHHPSPPDLLSPRHHSHEITTQRHRIGGGFRRPAVGKSTLQPHLPFSSLTSSVGSPSSLPSSRWNLDRKHILLLNFTACAAAISASWVFFSAIPTLLALKRAAGSAEKLLDVTAEELPETMAAVRLSGMEISDLTMELSDLGQEITRGVRSSTRAVRVAEDRLRRLTSMAPTVSVQGPDAASNEIEAPILARTARNLRDGIVKGRIVFGAIFSITQFSRWALNFLAARGQKESK